MRLALSATLLVLGTGLALAQAGSPSSGSSAPSAGAPPATTAPGTTLAPGAGAPPSTQSQQNLDLAPPGRNLPLTKGNADAATAPPPGQNSAAQPGQGGAGQPDQGNTAQVGQNPPPSGGRPPQGGANSSQQSVATRTGKNPLNESYTSCLSMWDTGTHMSKAEWSRACRRVDNRLQNLKVGDLPAVPATPRKSRRAEGPTR